MASLADPRNPIKGPFADGTTVARRQQPNWANEGVIAALDVEGPMGAILKNLGDSDIVLALGKGVANLVKDSRGSEAREGIEGGYSFELISQTTLTHPKSPIPNVMVGFWVDGLGSSPLGTNPRGRKLDRIVDPWPSC